MPVSIRDLDPLFTQGALVFRELMGHKIASRRKALRWSQEGLANESGWSRQQLSRVELGYSSIAADRLLALAEVLECEVTDLIPSKDEVAEGKATAQAVTLTAIAREIESQAGHRLLRVTRQKDEHITIEAEAPHGTTIIEPDEADCIRLADLTDSQIESELKSRLSNTHWPR